MKKEIPEFSADVLAERLHEEIAISQRAPSTCEPVRIDLEKIGKENQRRFREIEQLLIEAIAKTQVTTPGHWLLHRLNRKQRDFNRTSLHILTLLFECYRELVYKSEEHLRDADLPRRVDENTEKIHFLLRELTERGVLK